MKTIRKINRNRDWKPDGYWQLGKSVPLLFGFWYHTYYL